MRAFIAGKVEVGCERIEDLAAVRKVSLESKNTSVRVRKIG